MSMNYSEVIVVGDFNLPNINKGVESCNSTYGQSFLDVLNSHYLEQVNKEFTRYRLGNDPSLLDLIITSDSIIIQNSALHAPFGKKRLSCHNF